MGRWISVDERLPINSPEDADFNGTWYEKKFEVLINGEVAVAFFWACWSVTRTIEEDSEFLHEFDEEGVTHWRLKEGSE